MGILHQSAREEGPTCEIIYYACFRREHDAKAFLLQRRVAVALELSRLRPMMQERGRRNPMTHFPTRAKRLCVGCHPSSCIFSLIYMSTLPGSFIWYRSLPLE